MSDRDSPERWLTNQALAAAILSMAYLVLKLIQWII